MFKILIAAGAALFLTGAALADVTNTAASGSSSYSSSGSLSNASQGNVQQTIFNNPATMNYSGGYDVKTTPTVYAPPIGVSAPCHIALSGSVSVVGFGAGLGGSVLDPGCDLRETARLLYGIGKTDAAAKVMCANPTAAAALGEAICPTTTAGTLPAPQPPKPEPKTSAAPAPAKVAGKDGVNCYRDEIVAKRVGWPVCA